MSAIKSVPTSLLDLPPEIRREIFISLFRSTTVCKTTRGDNLLAILLVCRQLYAEAARLVLPNVRVYCYQNDDLLEMLFAIGLERIPQLRHVILSHAPVAFDFDAIAKESTQIEGGGGSSKEGDENGGTSNENGGHDGGSSNTESDSNRYQDYLQRARFFHPGPLLALFPGLQLDLLEVFCGMTGEADYFASSIDCFGSLLEADGYRRLWMEAVRPYGDEWYAFTGTEEWADAMERKFEPHARSKVQIKLTYNEWRYRDVSDLWDQAEAAGIILTPPKEGMDWRYNGGNEGEEDSDTQSEDGREYNGGREPKKGHENEGAADIVMDRGDADYVVKETGDNVVLKCIPEDLTGSSPEYFEAASDSLRKLFREHSWDTIRSMNGYNANGDKDFRDPSGAYL